MYCKLLFWVKVVNINISNKWFCSLFHQGSSTTTIQLCASFMDICSQPSCPSIHNLISFFARVGHEILKIDVFTVDKAEMGIGLEFVWNTDTISKIRVDSQRNHRLEGLVGVQDMHPAKVARLCAGVTGRHIVALTNLADVKAPQKVVSRVQLDHLARNGLLQVSTQLICVDTEKRARSFLWK